MLWTGDPGVGQMLTTAMFILISLNSVSDTAQNTLDAQLEARCKFKVHDIITCENERLNLQCPDDHSLLLTSIAFGRTDLYQCPHPSIKSTDCSSDTAPGIVRGECDGKNACSFEATTRFLNGDPCGGTFKYLNVSYTCLGQFQL
ncbi:hypothetical protein CAPTEDRAFT_207661 [Capitella teleta]|uniref:SUEL-type lectin domain-containing protein n=1 Tax=Capitella teleta TaxID=283909 RepID=R7UUN2_CAPTE|nr:hypothetical protein CAPTEDRAFT_207661 [Capitella teleta]|eukprot:ELU09878.1 hypothetical protein CAPTEDRAFT_207661 [Capitella teleta]